MSVSILYINIKLKIMMRLVCRPSFSFRIPLICNVLTIMHQSDSSMHDTVISSQLSQITIILKTALTKAYRPMWPCVLNWGAKRLEPGSLFEILHAIIKMSH